MGGSTLKTEVIRQSEMIHKHMGKNGHETDLEMSPRPLDTTIFEKKRIRTSCKRSHRSELGLKIRL